MRRAVANALAVVGLVTSPLAFAQTDITVVTWGGNIAKEMMEAWFVPATKGMNLRLREDALKGPSDIHAHVAAGKTNWDVVDAATDMCERGGRDGILEELDFNVVKTEGLPKDQVTKWSVPSTAYVLVLAWNKKKYGANPPKSWKDFWDVKNYPGTRFMGAFVTGAPEIALLADGVPPDKLYPLDVDRAFRKLAELRPHVTAFPTSYGQSTQLINDGEADMIYLPENRLFAALRNGADYGYTYHQGIMNFDCLVIPKTSKNKAVANRIIANVVSPEINARIVETSGLSPANQLSVDKGFVAAKFVPSLAMSPDNFKQVIVQNNAWWADNRAKLKLNERYNELKAAK